MAASVEFEDDNGQVVRYVRHANGGGLVSPLARVHEAAMVASTAYVEAGAQVGDRSRIGAGSWLDHDVIVGEDVVVAGKNAEGNGVAAVFRADTTPLSAIPGTFDLVLGNLIAEILIDMAADLARRTAPGGHLILSGILAEKSGWVIEEFGKNGASPVAETVDGPWAALLLRREA